MKKLLILLILICFTGQLAAENRNVPEPYRDEEFPTWMHDLRRGSTVFCGALPFGYMVSSGLYDAALDSGGFIEQDFYASMDDNEKIEFKLMSTVVFALSVTLIDFIIEKLFYSNGKKS